MGFSLHTHIFTFVCTSTSTIASPLFLENLLKPNLRQRSMGDDQGERNFPNLSFQPNPIRKTPPDLHKKNLDKRCTMNLKVH